MFVGHLYVFFGEMSVEVFCPLKTNVFIFYWRILLYRILWFSVKLQHESAIGIHISPPFWNSFPSPSPPYPSRLMQSPCVSFLSHAANSHWLSILHRYLFYRWVSLLFFFSFFAFFLIFILLYNTVLVLPYTSHPLLPHPHVSLFSMSVSPLLPCKKNPSVPFF